MPSGYSRQASANIQANLNINAEDFNNEFNTLASAFDSTSGHDHSGSVAGDGAKITLTSSVTGVLPVANGGTGNSTALFSSALTVAAGGVNITGNSFITGGITVSGQISGSGGIIVTGNSFISGTLATSSTFTVSGGGAVVTGNSSVTGTLSVSGLLNGAVGIQDSGVRVYSPNNTFKITNYQPADPPQAGFAAGTVMCGLGSALTFTPLISTRVIITISGNFRNDTSGNAAFVNLNYGTGTAPANGAASTGTILCKNVRSQDSAATSGYSTFSFTYGLSGLTLSTAYWFDLTQLALVGGNVVVSNITCNIHEI